MASCASFSGAATALVVILLAAASAACAVVGQQGHRGADTAPMARDIATAILLTRVIWFPDL